MTYPPQGKERALVSFSIIAYVLVTILVFSTPAKWATLHISGGLIVLSLFLSTRDFWISAPVRIFCALTLLWLLPVIGATVLQHTQSLDTAPSWSSQVTLVLRLLGVNLGVLLFLHKRYITLRHLAFIIIGCLAIHGIIGIGHWFLLPEASLTAWRLIRIHGIVGNPNPYGFFMVLGLILSADLLRNSASSRVQRIVLWFSTLIFVLGIFGSGSRGAIIAATAGFAVLFPPITPQRIGSYAAALIPLNAAYFGSSWQSINTLSDGSRAAALQFGLEVIAQHPLTGWGQKSFMDIPGHSSLPNHTLLSSPHNMLIDLAVSSGIIALATFLLSTVFICYQLLRLRTPFARMLLALLASAFVAGTLEYSIFSSTHFRGPWMLIIALACYAIGTAKNHEEQELSPIQNSQKSVLELTPAPAPVNILCLKWGTRYSPHYVNTLFHSAARNLDRPFLFHCCTDDATGLDPAIRIIPFPDNPGIQRGWPDILVKLMVFKDGFGALEGTTLFMDVDIVVLGKLDCFFDYKPGEYCIIHNWVSRRKELLRRRPPVGNSSVFRFEAGKSHDVYETFLREMHQAEDTRIFNTEQAFLTHAMKKVNWWPEEWVQSYKWNCRPIFPLNLFITPKVAPNCKILVFHGRPDPDEAIQGFSDGKPHHYIRPAPWLARYWSK